MRACQHEGQAPIVADEPPEARQQGKTALDYPAEAQEHEPTLRLGQLAEFQLDASGNRCAYHFRANVAWSAHASLMSPPVTTCTWVANASNQPTVK